MKDGLFEGRNLRKGRWSQGGFVYFLTKCLVRPSKICLTKEPIAEAICPSILHQKSAGAWHLLCFVVMPDHVHLLVALENGNSLSKTMGNFSRFTARQINRIMGSTGSVWQEGYHDHLVRRAVEKCPELTDYIHHNPVRKGLCAEPQAWPWSTAHPRYAPEVEADWFW